MKYQDEIEYGLSDIEDEKHQKRSIKNRKSDSEEEFDLFANQPGTSAASVKGVTATETAKI